MAEVYFYTMSSILHPLKYLVVSSILWLEILAERCDLNSIRLTCPREDEPLSFTRCCIHENTTDIYCCENPWHDRGGDQLVMMVSVTVILSCFLISALIIVCCFWSKCPLFDLCWVNYSRRGVIAYTKDEDLDQPPDENDYDHGYTPINVKINRVDDV